MQIKMIFCVFFLYAIVKNVEINAQMIRFAQNITIFAHMYARKVVSLRPKLTMRIHISVNNRKYNTQSQ